MKKLGFTLIELLIVIAIIGILVALILPNLAGARERARDSRRKTDLQSLQQALRLYYNDNKSFPTAANFTAGASLTNGTSTYISQIPFDPSSTTTSTVIYNYLPSVDRSSYIMYTNLENKSDPDISASKARCTGEPNLDTTYVVCEQ